MTGGLAERAAKARLGAGLDPQTQLGPLVSAEQQERVLGYIKSGVKEGAQLLAGGEATLGESGGFFVAPTLFASTSDELRIAREEIFGPVLSQPLRHARGSRSPRQRQRLRSGGRRLDARPGLRASPRGDLRAGSVYVNCLGRLGPAAPFGGFKASGVGREHGRVGLDSYLETKTVWAAL